jgi:DNA-directed RNA polymerase specialized sigma24 family protein
MDDPELAAAMVAGDPDGLAEALDRYAASLFTYSRAALPAADFGEEAAAEVVQDTFVIARAVPLPAGRDASRRE